MNHPPNPPPQNSETGDENQQDLLQFLRQHRPTPPPASNALRSQILTAIAQEATPIPKSRTRLFWWFVPSAIALTAIGSFVLTRSPGFRTAETPEFTPAEITELEDYLIASWNASSSITTDPFADWSDSDEPEPLEP